MKKEFVTYVLYSKSFDKIYIGFTSNLILRFKSHNIFGKGYTKKFRPWTVIYVEFFDTKPKGSSNNSFLPKNKDNE